MNQHDIDKMLDDMERQAEKDIDVVFAKRLKWLLARISALYDKYAKGGELTWTDVNLYGRYQKEMALIGQEISGDYKGILDLLAQLSEDTYVENYLRSAYLFEVTAQQLMGYSIPTAKAVKVAVQNPIAKLTLPALMQAHRDEIVRRIDIEISQGIMAGEDYTRISKRIQNAVGFSRSKAMNVAVTETGRVQVKARMDSAEKAEKYADMVGVWNATLDLHTRPAHRKLDGQEADENGYFNYHGMKAKGPHLWGVASMDCRCRCTKIYKVDGILPDSRRSRDYTDADYQQKLADRMDKLMEDGMTTKQAEKQAKKEISAPNVVVTYQTYDEWLENRFKKG
jgi:SPP1 gp7 family putative phage head morphogenesis protein